MPAIVAKLWTNKRFVGHESIRYIPQQRSRCWTSGARSQSPRDSRNSMIVPYACMLACLHACMLACLHACIIWICRKGDFWRKWSWMLLDEFFGFDFSNELRERERVTVTSNNNTILPQQTNSSSVLDTGSDRHSSRTSNYSDCHCMMQFQHCFFLGMNGSKHWQQKPETLHQNKNHDVQMQHHKSSSSLHLPP